MESENSANNLMTRAQFAEFCGVAPRTVDTWIRRKRITHVIKMGRTNFFKVDECLDEMGLDRETMQEAVRAMKAMKQQ